MSQAPKASSWQAPRSCDRRSSYSNRAFAALRPILAVAIFGFWPAGCGAANYPNAPLASQAANPEFHQLPPAAPDDPVIFMAFSGGGSRATALSIDVLRQLRGITYSSNGLPTRLIDRVQVVSSVSGGSVAAAYFGLYGPDKIDGIRGDFLDHDIMAQLEWTAANPITWLQLSTGSYTRIDALRDLFEARLFHGRTFAELNGPGHPITLLNATDMVSGEVFAFTPQRFDDICSDLAKMPISVGVASSAAFPIALSPMDLENHSGAGCAGAIPPVGWVEKDLNSRAGRYLNIEEYKRARYTNDLRHGPDAYRDIRYLHLLDGGVADNQGVHSLMDALFSPHGPVRLLDAINSGNRRSIVVISVNARSDPANPLDQDPHTPGVVSMVQSVTGVPLDSAMASLNSEMQVLIDTLVAAGRDAPRDASSRGLKVYGISIDFDQFLPPERQLRDRVKSIGTTWTLTPDDLNEIDKAATLLLRQHPCFQRLLADLGVQADYIDHAFADAACPVASNGQ